MNKKTKALTTEQYKEIIQTMKEGFCGCRPNERIATILVLEGNLGLRISDILNLRLCDIVRDGDRFRLEVVEQKTGKRRIFTVPLVIQQYIENYCLRNGIQKTETIFPISERAVQKQLAIVCDYLGYEGISTHSFRKWYATEIDILWLAPTSPSVTSSLDGSPVSEKWLRSFPLLMWWRISKASSLTFPRDTKVNKR